MKNKNFLSKIAFVYNPLEAYLLLGSLVFSVLLVFFQVIMRTVFHNSLSWSEELSRYIFIWQIWLGASIALKEDEHINVTLVYNMVKNKRAQACIKTFTDLVWFLFCFFLIFNGASLVNSIISRNTTSSGLGVPMAVIYIVLPISSAPVCLRLIPRLKNDIYHILGKATEIEKIRDEEENGGGKS